MSIVWSCRTKLHLPTKVLRYAPRSEPRTMRMHRSSILRRSICNCDSLACQSRRLNAKQFAQYVTASLNAHRTACKLARSRMSRVCEHFTVTSIERRCERSFNTYFTSTAWTTPSSASLHTFFEPPAPGHVLATSCYRRTDFSVLFDGNSPVLCARSSMRNYMQHTCTRVLR
jgi:hypothetical protein